MERKCKLHRPVFLSGQRQLEREIFQACGLPYLSLNIVGSPLDFSATNLLQRWYALGEAVRMSIRLLKEHHFGAVLLFGGYVSFPMLLASLLCRVPVVIHEQNAYAGKVTRLAAFCRVPVLSGWPSCAPLPRNSFIRVGIPVRRFRRLQNSEAWNTLVRGVVFREGPTILIFGGSLGSQKLEQLIRDIAQLPPFREWTFLFVTKGENLPKVMGNCVFVPQRWDPSPFYSLATVAIVRGGASTLAEMKEQHIPCVVVPWERASDAHQLWNARAFVDAGGGVLWRENDPQAALVAAILHVVEVAHSRTKIFSDATLSESEKICEHLYEQVVALTMKGDAQNGRTRTHAQEPS
jgi:UDP-N-acetylglucosamine--N-acetylmuramyl-(pentapeptide) pyrophosphoryl-undecaprenol N-acetylglucosamine transferase